MPSELTIAVRRAARRLLTNPSVNILMVRAITLASRFLLSIILARALSPEDLGYFGLLSAALPFGIVLIGLEFHNFLVREQVVATPGQRVEHIRNQGALYFCNYLVMLAGTAIFLLFRPDLLVAVCWFIALLAVEHLTIEASRNLIAFSRPLAANMILLVRGGLWVYAVGVVMAIMPMTRKVETVFIAWLVGGICGILIAIVLFRKLPWKEVPWHGVDWKWIKSGLRTSTPFMLIVASILTSTYCDRFFIDAYLPRRDVGIYTFFSMLAIGVQSLITSVSQQYLPLIIAAHNQGAIAHRHSLVNFARTMAYCSTAANALAIVAIYPLLWLIDKSDYSENLSIFFVLLAASALRGFADIPAHALYSASADRALLVSNIASALTAIGLSATLIPAVGLQGAAIGSLGASFILLMAEGAFALRRFGKRRTASAERADATADKPD
jgi:O-antigen/teichoic acid export membrane protein